MRRHMVIGGIALLAVLITSSVARAREFTSCLEVREYFKQPLPNETYARVQDLEAAVQALRADMEGPSEGCDDWTIERALRDRADELNRYSRDVVKNDPEGGAEWARSASRAAEEYLDWFLGLSGERQEPIIRVLLSKDRRAVVSPSERAALLRKRVGNVLVGLGEAFVRAKAHAEMLGDFERFSRVAAEGPSGVSVFPSQVVREWRKWLWTLPDFGSRKTETVLKALLSTDDEATDRLDAFKRFLDRWIDVNPSERDEWLAVSQKIARWLLR